MTAADPGENAVPDAVQRGWQAGTLAVVPSSPTREPLPSGLNWLAESGTAALFVPSALPERAVPLVVLLHGATSNPLQVLPIMQAEAERRKFLVLAPKSLDYTWDIIRGGFGPDVAELDRSLPAVFDQFTIDAERIAIAGFSDGASYALSLGLTNGELFHRILAFSPGFSVPGERSGKPSVFVSHGRQDAVLPIDRCSRPIVAKLTSQGYDVDYREFIGGHEVPADMVTAASDLVVTTVRRIV
ncbi:alpha/beta hydrolase [Jatrophihabitans sp. DSM 45814]